MWDFLAQIVASMASCRVLSLKWLVEGPIPKESWEELVEGNRMGIVLGKALKIVVDEDEKKAKEIVQEVPRTLLAEIVTAKSGKEAEDALASWAEQYSIGSIF